jgi:hypothetical protein
MKALSFLQFALEEHRVQREICLALGLIKDNKIYDSYHLLCKYSSYVSQPFTPEMVERFGFKMADDEWNYHKDEKYFIQFSDDYKITIYNFNFFQETPAILDKFIMHCQDAGIELEWKESE